MVQSSLVMLCCLPSAASTKNITPSSLPPGARALRTYLQAGRPNYTNKYKK